MSDFMLILSLLYYWPFGGWFVRVKKQRTVDPSWFHRKFNFLDKSIFGHFYDSIGYIKKSY